MEGAAILYNLELARLRRDAEHAQSYEHELERWAGELRTMEVPVREWRPRRFWELTVGRGHSISERARRFVESWLELSLAFDAKKADDPMARSLVRARERSLKGTRSRFDNPRALEQWSGAAGLGIPSYRWPITERLLADLFAGLSGEAPHA